MDAAESRESQEAGVKVSIRMLGPDDEDVLTRVAPEVFDFPIRPDLAAEFLADPRHHLAVAIDARDVVVGFASGVHYVHPDKPAELFVNEVGVSPDHRNRGIGTALLECLFAHAKSLGCREAWVLTDDENAAARRMYARAGGVETDPPARMIAFDLAPKPN